MSIAALGSLHEQLVQAFSALTLPRVHVAVTLEGERLSVVRSERDDAGEIVSVIEESLTPEAASLLSSTTPARISTWVAAYARLQDEQRMGLLGSLVLVAHTPLQSVDDFAAAMVDDDLVLAVQQQHDPAWWGQESEWERAWQAAGIANFVVLDAMITARPSLVVERDGFGFSLLHNVVERCDAFSASAHRRTLALLLARGADVNAAPTTG